MDDFVHRQFPHLLADWGYVAIVLAVAADSLGVPIPGEAMVILAGMYAGGTHHLAVALIVGAAAAGAIAGDNVTYTVGRLGGYPLLRRHGERFHLGPKRLLVGRYLFLRFGGHVVWAGRLIPVLHIWTAILAGTNRMPWWRFALANAAGAVIWGTILSVAGYGLGSVALRFGDAIAGGAVPLAILIGLSTIVLLRMNERRLVAAAERALGEDERDEVSGE